MIGDGTNFKPLSQELWQIPQRNTVFSRVVMLSDPSTVFGVDVQGGVFTINGVETSVYDVRCFDSVQASSSQADLVADIYKRSLNMTGEAKMACLGDISQITFYSSRRERARHKT
jgi:hypothetical protein